MLAFAPDRSTGMIGAFLIGFGAGSESDVVPYVVARFFDKTRFATIYGLTWTAYALGAAFGPVLMGRIFDRQHAYPTGSVLLFTVPCLIAAAMQMALPSYPSTVQTLTAASESLVNVT